MQISRLCLDSGPHVDYSRGNSGYPSIPQIPSLPQHLAPNFFDKHAPGLAVWKKKGIQWKEKGPQTHTHRHEHMFTGDHRTRQGQKPSSGAAKGAISIPRCGCRFSGPPEHSVAGGHLTRESMSFASTLGYLFLFWDYRSQFGSVTNKN